MPKLPRLSGIELIKYLKKKGFVPVKQHGSHVKLKSATRTVIVPIHDELDTGTVLAILEEAGISRDEFIQDWYG